MSKTEQTHIPCKSLGEYVRRSMRTDLSPEQYDAAAKRLAVLVELDHAFRGMATESGELLDKMKKFVYYGNKDEFIQNVQEEMGDLMWYVAKAMDWLTKNYGITPSTILDDNLIKLEKRYPEKFTEEKAMNRDTTTELGHIVDQDLHG